MLTVPCDGLVFAVTVRAVPLSLPSTVGPVTGVFAEVVMASLVDVGVTVRFTVAVVV